MPDLPPVPRPAGHYQPVVRTGRLVFTAGMTPRRDGELVVRGRVGGEVDLATARAAAGIAAANALAAAAVGAGSLAALDRLVRVTVFVAAAPGFADLDAVGDAAVSTLARLLGSPERAGAARSIVGLPGLPGGAPVEVELVASCRDEL